MTGDPLRRIRVRRPPRRRGAQSRHSRDGPVRNQGRHRTARRRAPRREQSGAEGSAAAGCENGAAAAAAPGAWAQPHRWITAATVVLRGARGRRARGVRLGVQSPPERHDPGGSGAWQPRARGCRAPPHAALEAPDRDHRGRPSGRRRRAPRSRGGGGPGCGRLRCAVPRRQSMGPFCGVDIHLDDRGLCAAFTRGRPSKEDDHARIEQTTWTRVAGAGESTGAMTCLGRRWIGSVPGR
jgi:hypothetical protein